MQDIDYNEIRKRTGKPPKTTIKHENPGEGYGATVGKILTSPSINSVAKTSLFTY